MYRGALGPSLILMALYLGYVLAVTLFRPAAAPALPAEARTLHGAALARKVVVSMLPPLLLIFLVLGTIFLGIATPTEGGAMGAVGALGLAWAKRRLPLDLLRQATDSTAKLTTFVLFILVGSRVFSLVFYGLNGDVWVEHLLISLPGGRIGFLLVVNILVFLLAFFLDFFEIAFIIVPLLAPVAHRLGIDLVWFGVLLGFNMQTSFMHPPFGFALFYLRSVAPAREYVDKITGKLTAPITTGQIYWGAVPFVIIQIVGVATVLAFPQLVTGNLHELKVDTSKIHISVPPPDYGQPELGEPGGTPDAGDQGNGPPAPPAYPGQN